MVQSWPQAFVYVALIIAAVIIIVLLLKYLFAVIFIAPIGLESFAGFTISEVKHVNIMLI